MAARQAKVNQKEMRVSSDEQQHGKRLKRAERQSQMLGNAMSNLLANKRAHLENPPDTFEVLLQSQILQTQSLLLASQSQPANKSVSLADQKPFSALMMPEGSHVRRMSMNHIFNLRDNRSSRKNFRESLVTDLN